MCLLRFTKYVALKIYCEWLDLIEFCKLDLAICNHVERALFLELIGNESVRIPGLGDAAVFTAYLKWVSARNLRLKSLVIEQQLKVQIHEKCLPCFCTLRELTINNFINLFSSRLIGLVNVCSDLRTFSLNTGDLIGDGVMNAVAKTCKFLMKIDLNVDTRNDITDNSITKLGKNCTELQSVRFVNLNLLHNPSIVSLVKNCTKLTELILINVPRLTNTSIAAIAKYCRNLTTFALRLCPGVDAELVTEILDSNSEMKHFECDPYYNTYSNIGTVSKYCISRSDDVEVVDRFANLATLCLGETRITESMLNRVSSKCKQLLRFEMTTYELCGVSEVSLIRFMECCRSLEWLKLGPSQIAGTGKVLAAIMHNLRNLHTLDIHHWINVKMDTFSTIDSFPPNLTSIRATDLGYSRKHYIVIKVLSMCKSLKYLDIYDAEDTYSEGIWYVYLFNDVDASLNREVAIRGTMYNDNKFLVKLRKGRDLN